MKLLTQQEVARVIRKSESWLERKRWEGGGIPYRKVGRMVIYEEVDVLKWLDSHPKHSVAPESGSTS